MYEHVAKLCRKYDEVHTISCTPSIILNVSTGNIDIKYKNVLGTEDTLDYITSMIQYYREKIYEKEQYYRELSIKQKNAQLHRNPTHNRLVKK